MSPQTLEKQGVLDRIDHLKKLSEGISEDIAKLDKTIPTNHYQNEIKVILKEILEKQKVMNDTLTLLLDYSFKGFE